MRRTLLAASTVLALAGCGATKVVTHTQTTPPAAAVAPPTQTVTQVVKTVTQQAPAATAAPTPTAAPAPTPAPAAAPVSAAVKVPGNLVGKNLVAVENELDGDGIGYRTVGGGAFGIVLKGDWGVCGTTPAAGHSVSGPVQLVVGHFTCGA